MTFRNLSCVLTCLFVFAAIFVADSRAQVRPRVVPAPDSQTSSPNVSTDRIKRTVLSSPTTQPVTTTNTAPSTNPNQRPVLTNQIVVEPSQASTPLVKKTASSMPVNSMPNASAKRLVYGSSLVSDLMQGIQSRLGIPYRLGSTGPNRYDCSGFIWSVFNEAGIFFERSNARTFWSQFEPVEGEERFEFGTLVFFNRLGHVGIVVDENGFYHASQSKGITYSPFKGYWEKRIDGFRRIPVNYFFSE